MDANYRRWKRNDPEFEQNAVDLLESAGRSIAEVASDLGIPYKTPEPAKSANQPRWEPGPMLLPRYCRTRECLVAMALLLSVALANAQPAGGERGLRDIPRIALTLIPPSPVTDQISVEVRTALRNPDAQSRSFATAVYLDNETSDALVHEETVVIEPGGVRGAGFHWPARGHAGRHRLLLVARSGELTIRAEQPLEILSSTIRSTRRLGGAWVDLYHHDEAEGKPFNAELARMSDTHWRELVRAMHAVDQDLLVITMMFQNFAHRGRHQIETAGYHGKAYYPSQLFPDRMPIASPDPLEAILSEADGLGMHVMPGVGMYAFFDYTTGSLSWHKKVSSELWQRYGHHPSFYGWYVSGEKVGSLGDSEERGEIVEFFREFTAHVRRLAPDKPVMLAPNCFGLRDAEAAYLELLPHLDIICPFGFHRMPEGDLTGEEAASRMQSWCDQAGCHLWMDMESFEFRNSVELHPRPIAGLVSDLTLFPGFEKTLHYQFPGMMSSPEMSRKPGGEPSVKLFEDYRRYLEGRDKARP